jgi:hypothetical protein
MKMFFTVQIDCTDRLEVCVMKSELKEIILEGYKLFSNYKITSKLDVCPCCVSEEEQAVLIKTPLENIPLEALSIYNNSATSEVININEFKYFLPRMLELIAELKFPSHSVEITLSRIGYTSLENWLEAEVVFLRKFMESFFVECLIMYPFIDFENLCSVIIMFSKTNFDVTWTAKVWETVNDLESVMHFIETIDTEIKISRFGKLKIDNGFADNRMNFLTEWLQDKKTIILFKEKIEMFLVKENYRGEYVERMNNAYEILCSLENNNRSLA